MHDVTHFYRSVERARSRDPIGWIGVMLLAMQRVGVDLPRSAARRGTRPRGSWAGSVRPIATVRNNAPSGQLVGSWTRMRAICSITRAPILIRRSRIVANSAPASGLVARDRGAHAVHQPERSSVKNEPYLIGDRAVT